jgi:hypothetical protein
MEIMFQRQAAWGFQFGLTRNFYPNKLKFVEKVGWGFPVQNNEQLFFLNKFLRPCLPSRPIYEGEIP